MRLGAGLPRPPEIELSTLPTPSVNGTERLAGSACAGCCYLSAPSRRDVQWAPGLMQKDGRYPVDVFAVWPEGSQFLLGHLPAVARAVFWLPIAPCVSSIFHAASASGCDLTQSAYTPSRMCIRRNQITLRCPLPIRVSPRKGSGQFSSG